MAVKRINKTVFSFGPFQFDWTKYLGVATISSHSVTIKPDSITLANISEGSGIVSFDAPGGTEELLYTVTCQITASDGRKDERFGLIFVTPRAADV